MNGRRTTIGLVGFGIFLIIAIGFYFINLLDSQDLSRTNESTKKESTTAKVMEVKENTTIVGTLENIKGNVFVYNSDDEKLIAENGMEIVRGWEVRTEEESVVTLRFTSEMKTVLGENTQIVIEEVDLSEASDEIRLNQLTGTLWNAGQHDNYVVETPELSLEAIGTHFLVTVDPDTQYSTVSMLSGIVGVTDRVEEEMEQQEPAKIIPTLQLNTDPNIVYSSPHTEGVDDEFTTNLIDAIKNTTGTTLNVSSIAPEDFINALQPDVIKEIIRSIQDIKEENANNNYPGMIDGILAEDHLNELKERIESLLTKLISEAMRSGKIKEEELEQFLPEMRGGLIEEVRIDLGKGHQEKDDRGVWDIIRERHSDRQEGNEREREKEVREKLEKHKKNEKEQNQTNPPPAKVPKNGPVKLTFTDTDPFVGQLAGEVKITKATDETDITQYILYWANGTKEKLNKIATINKTGQNLRYTISANTKIPKDATGLVAVSANNAGESQNFAYVEINDYQAMTVINPLSNQEVFVHEQKVISLDSVFMDSFGKFINPEDPAYDIKISSSDKEIAFVDSSYNIIGGKAGRAEITVTVTNKESKDSVSDTFTVNVKETGITGNINLTSLLPDKNFDFKVTIFAHNQKQNIDYETEVDLVKGEDSVPFELSLPRGSYTISYGLTDDNRYPGDGESVFLYHSGKQIDITEEKKQVNLSLPVMEDVEVDVSYDGFELSFGDDKYTNYDVFVDGKLYASQDRFIAIDGLSPETTYKVRVHAQTEEDESRIALSAVWFGTITTTKELEEPKPEIPHYGPEKITFKDINPLAGKLAGDIRITKAIDETNITSYVLYWANRKKEKLDEITKIDSSGENITYTFSEKTNIPKNATGLLAVSTNEAGESQNYAYVEIKDYQAMTVKNPLSNQKISVDEYKFISLDEVFIDAFEDFIQMTDPAYDIQFTSTDEEVVWVDSGFNLIGGKAGTAKITVKVINRESEELVSDSFTVEVRERVQGAGVSGHVQLTSLLPEEDFDFKVTLNWIYISDIPTAVFTEIDLARGEQRIAFEKTLNPGTYNLRSYTLSSELWDTDINFYDTSDTLLIETIDQHALMDDLIIPVMDGVTVGTSQNGFELNFGSNVHAKYEVFVDGQAHTTADNHIVINELEPETMYKVRVVAYSRMSGGPPSAVWFGKLTTDAEPEEQQP